MPIDSTLPTAVVACFARLVAAVHECYNLASEGTKAKMLKDFHEIIDFEKAAPEIPSSTKSITAGQKTVSVQVRMPKAQSDELSAAVKVLGISKSRFIRMAMERSIAIHDSKLIEKIMSKCKAADFYGNLSLQRSCEAVEADKKLKKFRSSLTMAQPEPPPVSMKHVFLKVNLEGMSDEELGAVPAIVNREKRRREAALKKAVSSTSSTAKPAPPSGA
jgi:SMC interacting uncharacterized protein involved in chromosome segregation